MPVAAIKDISNEGIAYQWFTDQGNMSHAGVLPWEHIQCAKVFKRDLLSYDLICLHLLVADDVIEFDEEDENWKALMEAMPRHLSGCAQWGDWFSEVAFPAFETNERLFFQK